MSDNISRIYEGIEAALKLAQGLVRINTGSQEKVFNQKLSCPDHDIEFPPLEPRLFSFNSPFGACDECEGLGLKKEIDQSLVMPDLNKTINEGGFIPWSYKRNNYYGVLLNAVCREFGIPQNTRIKDLTASDKNIILKGPGSEYDNNITIKYRFKSSSGQYDVKWNGIMDHLIKRYYKTQSSAVQREIEKYMRNKA